MRALHKPQKATCFISDLIGELWVKVDGVGNKLEKVDLVVERGLC